MSWQSIVANVAQAVLGAVTPTKSTTTPASPPNTTPGLQITATGLTAFVNFAGPIVRIVEGKGTLTDDVAAANAVMTAIATFDPAAIPIVTLIETAEPAFEAIAALVKSGGVQGGYPDIGAEKNAINIRDR